MKKIINILCGFNVSTVLPISLIYCSTHHTRLSNKSKNNEPKNNKVKRYMQEMEENLIFNDLDKNGIDGSHLTVNNKMSDVLDLIQEKILLDDPQAEDIKLKNVDLTDFLTAGNNTIKFSFKINGKNKIVNAHITDVQQLEKANDINEEEAKKTIVKNFTNGIIANNLYGWSTIFDALTYFQNEAKKISPNAYIKFSDQYIVSKLGKKMF